MRQASAMEYTYCTPNGDHFEMWFPLTQKAADSLGLTDKISCVELVDFDGVMVRKDKVKISSIVFQDKAACVMYHIACRSGNTILTSCRVSTKRAIEIVKEFGVV
jgi:hypothetical protein